MKKKDDLIDKLYELSGTKLTSVSIFESGKRVKTFVGHSSCPHLGNKVNKLIDSARRRGKLKEV